MNVFDQREPTAKELSDAAARAWAKFIANMSEDDAKDAIKGNKNCRYVPASILEQAYTVLGWGK